MKRLRIVVKGLVQGVLFRAYAKRRANSLGLNGYVKNMQDGSVAIVVEGDDSAVESFLRWCKRGSPASRVASVDAEEEDYRNEFVSFEIRY